MNKRERIEAVIHKRQADRIPWTMYKSLPPWGEAELKLRNNGLAMIYQHFPVCSVSFPDVEIFETTRYCLGDGSGRTVTSRQFKTPVGAITIEHEFFITSVPAPGDLMQKFGSEIDQETLSWVTKPPFENESDYDVMEYVYNNISFRPNYEDFAETESLIGEEGVIFANVGKSPFQMLLYELMGHENLYSEILKNPEKVRSLYELLYKKQREKYKMAADSPAEIIWAPENMTSILTPPNLFKEYCLPFYNEMADILHARNKIFALHMDGELKPLAQLIGESKIDIIEAFTPPPMGNLTVPEARSAWSDKVIWVNFPETLLTGSDAKSVEEYTVNLLKDFAPGDNFILGCTENYPFEHWDLVFGAIGRVLERCGVLPLSF